MKKKLIITITILICIILLNILYHTNTENIIKSLYQYPISKNSTYKNYIYDIYSSHINIKIYNGNEKIVKIPSHISGKPVQSIEDSTFYGNNSIEEVTIPNTVIKIGYQSFIGCEKLKKVYIPTSIIYIGNSAFDNCPNLEGLYIEKNSKQEDLLEEKNYGTYIKYK